MSNQRLLSVTIKPEVQANNPDDTRKKNHQSIQIKSINQSIKEEDTQNVSTSKDTQKPPVSKHAPIPKKHHPSGEGWWVKPVDSPYVEAVWTPKCTAKTTTWEPIANPPKFFSYLEKFEF